jgi:hypothetical protein
MMRLPLVTAFVALLSCGSATEPGAPSLRVLFVGNSLTYTNDLPTMVQAIARADGESLAVKSLTGGGWGLEDHWNTGTARQEIASGKWDVVVMQQGPSTLEASRIDLDTWALKFDSLADANGTCLAFYMVWPDASRKAYFGLVYAHYKEAADTTGGQFLPGGDAWQRAWETDASIPFYGPDNFHPSPLGTYAAALVIAGGLTGKDPTTNTAIIPGVPSSGAQWAATRAGARSALQGVPRRCVGG